MLLTIDIGNTNITLGAFNGDKLHATWRMATDPRKMPDEYGAIMHSLLTLKQVSPTQINEIAMCSVVPPLTSVLERACLEYFQTKPLVIGPGVKTGIRVHYDNPRDVGSDRIADAVAGYRLYGGPLIIVDFGTATTFNAVSREGDYLGGAIAPGLRLAAESLFTNTSQLRRVDLVAPKSAIGRSTIASMQSGLVLGHVAMVEGMVVRIKEEVGQDAKVVATGGLARLIAEQTKVFDTVNPDLTLIGLKMVYELNREVPPRGTSD